MLAVDDLCTPSLGASSTSIGSDPLSGLRSSSTPTSTLGQGGNEGGNEGGSEGGNEEIIQYLYHSSSSLPNYLSLFM